MFKTLDTVKWETLETQFGYASEIPKLNILEVSATNTDVLDGLNDMPFMRGCIGTYAARVLEDIRTAHWRMSHPYFTANPDFEANKPEE